MRKSYLSDLKLVSIEKVTFGDGVSCKIVLKGRLNYPRLSSLNDVMLVDSFMANLISLCQLCDQGMNMSFSKG